MPRLVGTASVAVLVDVRLVIPVTPSTADVLAAGGPEYTRPELPEVTAG